MEIDFSKIEETKIRKQKFELINQNTIEILQEKEKEKRENALKMLEGVQKL
jgi:hypothetical protein